MERRWLKYLILLYVALIPLSKVWTLPVTGTSLQPAELVFICIFIYTVLFQQDLLSRFFEMFKRHISLVILLAVTAGAVFIHLDQTSFLNGLGTIYLIVACIYLASVFERFEHWFKPALIAYLAGCCVLALSAIFGGVLKWGWGPAGELALTQTMPWIGQVHRVCGFSETPTMLGMSLAPALIILVFSGKELLRHFEFLAVMGLIGLAALASLSKAVFILGVVFLAVTGFRLNDYLMKWMAVSTSIVLLLGLLFTIHFYPSSQDRVPESPLLLQEPAFELEDRSVYPTNYVLAHAVSLKLGVDHFWTGVGPGNIPKGSNRSLFDNIVWQDAAEKIKPAAHNWWLGAFASMGIVGLLAVILLSVILIGIIHMQFNHQTTFGMIIATVLLFWMTEGLVTDVMHFRPAWLFLAFGMAVDRI